ncbi:MAG: secretin and TonB N-terminal domain-containing protein [Chitinophagaceae bacterium]|nr:secretin and TonB N-terminal domain-containing protein [Chitinophagaceae bacterium]
MPVRGQSISASVKETEISKVLAAIERQGDYRFLFNSRLKDLKQKITVSLDDQDLNIALSEIFAGTNLTFKKITNNLIAIRSTDPAEQDVKITGKITSDAGEPLSGVSILVKGTTKGTNY